MRSFDIIFKSIERKFAYAFCTLRILVDLVGAGLAIAGFAIFIKMANSISTYAVCIVVFLICLFVVAADIHFISRDIRHIRSTNTNKKEDMTKKNKIEF